MTSDLLMRALAAFYVLIALVAVYERRGYVALYWLSALGITLAVRGMGKV